MSHNIYTFLFLFLWPTVAFLFSVLAFSRSAPIYGVFSKKALINIAFPPLKLICNIRYNLGVRRSGCLDISITRDMTYTRGTIAVSHLLRNLIPASASVASVCHSLAGTGIFFGVLPKLEGTELFKGGFLCCPS